jgi:hypothetical protein
VGKKADKLQIELSTLRTNFDLVQKELSMVRADLASERENLAVARKQGRLADFERMTDDMERLRQDWHRAERKAEMAQTALNELKASLVEDVVGEELKPEISMTPLVQPPPQKSVVAYAPPGARPQITKIGVNRKLARSM